jgi:hypothetical protein
VNLYSQTSLVAALVIAMAMPASSAAAEKKWQAPRLDHGRPDFQGRWVSTNATPLVRAPHIQTLKITAQQAAELDAVRVQKAEDRSKPTEPTEFYDERRIEPISGEYRSSIIVDPANGALPGTPLFNERLARAGADVMTGMDGPEQRPSSERCLGSLGSQAPMLSTPGGNVRQIVQTEGSIMFLSEENHEARIIRMNAVHRPASVTSWSGDSIGWWEGDTLVVDTRFFSPSDSARSNGSSTLLVTPQTIVVERFTRVSRDEINYLFTVEDPLLYTQRWTGESHFLRTDAPLLEYACHEGNYSLAYILQGARVKDGTLR